MKGRRLHRVLSITSTVLVSTSLLIMLTGAGTYTKSTDEIGKLKGSSRIVSNDISSSTDTSSVPSEYSKIIGDVTTPTIYSDEFLSVVEESPLSEYGQVFLDAEYEYGVSAIFLYSVVALLS